MKTQKAIDTQNAILEAAGILFSQKSVNKVSVSEITKRAGVAKGTFYVHFESKDDLVWHFIETQLGGVFNWFDIFKNYGYEQSDIDQIVDFIISYITKNTRMLKVVHNCGFFTFLGTENLEKKYLSKMTMPVEVWLSEGKNQGRIQIVDADFTAYFLVLSVHELIDRLILNDTPYTLDDFEKNMKFLLYKLIK